MNSEIKAIVKMVVFAVVLVLFFALSIFLGIKLGVSQKKSGNTQTFIGVDNGKYERF